METQVQTLQIQLPVVQSAPLPVPAEPAPGAMLQLVELQSKSPDRRAFQCKDLLRGETLQQAERDARELFGAMQDNQQIIMTYGNSDLQGMNQLADRLLHEVRPIRIPELKKLMQDLNGEMRGIKNRYDVTDPKVRERYEETKGKFLGLFRKAKDWLDMFMEDVTSIERQLDKVEDTLAGRQLELLRNIGLYDELYDENEAEIAKVIYAIAVMEIVSEMAATAADETPVGEAGMGDRGGEEKARLAQLSEQLRIRAHDWKGRLFIAFATAPQVRTMRGLDIGLAQKLDTLINSTIPTMKLVIAQWRMAMAALEAAQMAEVTAEAFNEWVTTYFENQGQTVPEIAKVINDPIMASATIAAIAKSIDDQATGIIQAMEVGEARRRENNEAMAAAEKVMTNATERVSDALVDRVLDASTKPLEITTSVPSTPAN